MGIGDRLNFISFKMVVGSLHKKQAISLNELRSSIIKLGDGITFEIFRIAIDRNYIESIFCIGIVRR